MSEYPVAERSAAFTHTVDNQPPPLENYNLITADPALVEAIQREGAGRAEWQLSDFGRLCGSAERIEWGLQANANKPRLHTHDRCGQRVDLIEYDPAYG